MVKSRSILITGANSGLGFEAAAQLAEFGYQKIILACRTIEKADDAGKRLVERVGKDVFESLAVDVSSISSANRAVDELVSKGEQIDQILLNAGIVPGDELRKSEDGVEMTFASSLIGHHILANRLLKAGLISEDGRIVLVTSEGARGDLPAAMGLKLYDFATSSPTEFGDTLHGAMTNFATGSGSVKFEGMRQYAVTKLFSTWWASEMAERYGDRVSVFAVSPGASLTTNAARNVKDSNGSSSQRLCRCWVHIWGLISQSQWPRNATSMCSLPRLESSRADCHSCHRPKRWWVQ